jgi:zinc transport system ATP-binding protein
MAAETAVRFENVTVAKGEVSILENVTAIVPRGSWTAIVGPNGAGKTTLLLTLLEEVSYTGNIINACRPSGGCSRIGYVPQRLAFDRGIPLTVTEFLVAGMQRKPLWLGINPKRRERALNLLAAVEIEHLAGRKLGALSGGELQRVLLALALEQEPDLLLLDEPASGIDFEGEQVFCGLLEKLRQEWGFTQIMVSHDLATVMHHATHVICLNRRVVTEGPPQFALTRTNLQTVFGPHLGLVDLRALPNFEANGHAPCCPEKCHD